MGFDENQAISATICIEHFEKENLNFARGRFSLKKDTKPSIFVQNDLVCQISEADPTNTISVCGSECEKIELLREIKELRESVKTKGAENTQNNLKYQIKIQQLTVKNDELNKKVAALRSKAHRLESTRTRLNSSIRNLKEEKMLTDKFSKGLQVKTLY